MRTGEGLALLLVIGLVGTFGLLMFAGLQSGYISNHVFNATRNYPEALLINGSRSLIANWDAGAYRISLNDLVIGGDTNLYRDSVNILATDDQFQIGDGTNKILLKFDSERDWHFVSTGSGGGTDLRLRSETDAKFFSITPPNNDLTFLFYIRAVNPYLKLLDNTTLYFRDSDLYIRSLNDGHLDFYADVRVNMNTPIVAVGENIITFSLTPNWDYLKWSSDEKIGIDSGNGLRITSTMLDISNNINIAGFARIRNYLELIPAIGQDVIAIKVVGDATHRFKINTAGQMAWGDGTNARDVYLYRSGADRLRLLTGDYLEFRDAQIYVTSLDDGHLDLEADISIDMNANVDMEHNYILNMDYTHMTHFSMTQGVTDIEINVVPVGFWTQDHHFHKLGFSVDTAPGAGKWSNCTITDGTNEITVSLTDAETSGSSTTGEFDLDVSAETFTIHYSQTGGGSSEKGMTVMLYHYKENE